MFSEYSINGYWFILFLTLMVLLHLIIEILFHQRRLKKIKFRIHVNGTRGKSSVARLIAAGLRGGDIRTVCKTTGTMARYICPEGVEEPIVRLGRTNVIEQIKVVKKADAMSPDALVIECMAVQPLLQSLCELKLVQSNVGVLSNAKADHLDVMGPSAKDVALALAATVPIKGHFFTPESKYLSVFQMATRDRKTQLHHISREEILSVTDEEMSHFSYVEYKENVALALKVCEHCGVGREAALQGMWHAKPDPGALIVKSITHHDKTVTLANGFAANDPESTQQLWEKIIALHSDIKEVVGIVNCRADRGDRSRQMAEAIVHWPNVTHLLIVGSGCSVFFKYFKNNRDIKIKNGEGYDPLQVLNYLTENTQSNHILAIGICNIAEIGFALIHYFFAQEGQA